MENNQKFKEFRENYLELFERFPYPLALMDMNGIFLDLNENMKNTMGFTKEDIKNKHFANFRIAPENYQQKLINYLNHLIKKEIPEPIEIQLYKKDYCLMWVRIVSAITIYNMNPLACIVFQDISEKKLIEDKLRNYSHKLEILNKIFIDSNKTRDILGLMDNVLSSILKLMDFDGGGVYLTDETTRLANIVTHRGLPSPFIDASKSVKIDNNPYNLVYLKGESIITENYNKVNPTLAEKFGLKSVASVPIFTGETIIGSLNIASKKRYIFTEEEKNIIKSIGMEIGSVIARIKALSELKNSNDRFKQITENAGEWIWELDKNGLYTYSNSAVEHILGYNSKEIVGKKYYSDLIHSDKKIDLKNSNFTLLSEKSPWKNVIYHKLHKNGKTVIIKTNGLPILDNNGNLLSFRGVDKDITEQEKTEKKLNSLLQQLSLALEFKSRFMANVSHNLRTPLNAIIGFSDLLQEAKNNNLNTDQLDYISDIRVSAYELLELINSMLDLSKIEVGKLDLSINKFDLFSIIQELKGIVRSSYQKKGLTFYVEGIKKEFYIYADPIKFKQILYNLLDNAIKFTEKGNITIRMIERSDDWEFQIEDTGLGIAKEDYEVVFREFGQIEKDITKPVSGSGLGLALTKRLIELHKGHIWFESELGKGSTFYFSIPKSFKEMNKN